MKKLLIATFLCCSFLNAQFIIKGKIENYNNKRVLIKLNNGLNPFIAGNLTTNSNGEFSQKITQKYIGTIFITLLDANSTSTFIADNKDLSINIKENGEILDFGNKSTKTYYDYLTYSNKKEKAFDHIYALSNLYEVNEVFFNQLEIEKNNLKSAKEPDYKSGSFLNYYIPSFLLNKKAAEGKTDLRNEIVKHFTDSGEYFQTSGIEKSMLLSYIQLCGVGQTQEEVMGNIEKGLDNLLENVGEDTNRGQELLAGMITLLNTYEITQLADKYMKRASSLICEITPELKKVIKINSEIKEGNKIPNVKFSPKLGKYSDLYSIRANQKLIIVWASWCGHCQQEKPYIKQFYENFKNKGGEIVTLAVDTDKNAWNDFVEDLPWLNYTDLLGWDSSFAIDLNVTGTPTLFLLDKSNKIIKIASSISEINNFINK